MSDLQQITGLFSNLALQLHTPISSSAVDQHTIDLSISDLNRQLNPNADASPSRVRVLDTVLSLMCFKAPQVFDLRVEYLVRTIISVLSASVDCKALVVQNRQILLVGSSFSSFDCFKLLASLDDLIRKLEDRRIHSFNLLHAAIRTAALAGCSQRNFTQIPTLNMKSSTSISPFVSRLISYVPVEILLGDQGIQLRLMIWYLDPFLLKRDVSKVLQEVKERPFICLSDEFRKRIDWNSLIKCLALCPAMFIETRTLLHRWFLMTGSSFVHKLHTHLMTTLLDVISRPTWWGISMDVGSKLPFLHAYFPCNIHLLRLLAGPLSLESFISLVQVVEKVEPCSKRNVEKERKQLLTVASIHHHSKWGITIAFPSWFLFSTLLLFCDRFSGYTYHPKDILRVALSKQMLGVESSSSYAASYIAWILCPVNDSEQNNLKDRLVKVSGSLTKQFLPETLEKERGGHRKKLKKLKSQAKGSNSRLTIGQWLEQFQITFTNFSGFCYQESYLLRNIPLGVLLVFSNYLNEDESRLLLHYGATGRIHIEGTTNEAITGAHFVFDITDAIENMSGSLFDTDEESQGFIHQIKELTEKYLLECIWTLFKAECDGDDKPQMLMDLHSRILLWRCQGEDSPFESQHLNEFVTALNEKVLCL